MNKTITRAPKARQAQVFINRASLGIREACAAYGIQVSAKVKARSIVKFPDGSEITIRVIRNGLNAFISEE